MADAARKTTNAAAKRAAAKAANTAAQAAETAAANGEVIEGVASEAVDLADNAAKTVRGISAKSGNLGAAFGFTALSLWSAAYAYTKFRQALGKPSVPVPPPPAAE